MDKVSIIIPVFNTEYFLENCIKSVMNQSYGNIEIVLVNDGSTDNSGIICKRYADAHVNIKYINKENSGQADSRFVGFLNSTGDYIYCVDSDDTIEKDAVKILMDGIKHTNSDMFYARFRLIDELGNNLKETQRYNVKEIVGNENIIIDALTAANIKASLCIKICKRELWNKCYIDSIRQIHYNEDYLLTVLFSINSKKVGFSNEIVYNAMQRTNSVSRGIKKDMVKAHDYYFPIIYNNLKTINLERNLQKYFYLGYGKNLYYSLIIGVLNSKNYKFFKELYNAIDSQGIYFKSEFIKTIRRISLQYRLLDIISRLPRLYYLVFKGLSKFINQ